MWPNVASISSTTPPSYALDRPGPQTVTVNDHANMLALFALPQGGVIAHTEKKIVTWRGPDDASVMGESSSEVPYVRHGVRVSSRDGSMYGVVDADLAVFHRDTYPGVTSRVPWTRGEMGMALAER